MAKFWELNITKVDNITRVVDKVISWTKQNGAPLGGIINCAGIGTAAKVGRVPSASNIFASPDQPNRSYVPMDNLILWMCGTLLWTST